MTARVIVIVALAGCTPTNLLKATTTYSSATSGALREVAGPQDVATSVCHVRAEIEYLTLAAANGQQSFDAFYETPATHSAPTWRHLCDGYRLDDAAFAANLRALAAYADALGAFAGDNTDAGTGLGAIAKAVGGEIATDVPALSQYKGILSGAGDALGRVLTVAEVQWKAKKLGDLTRNTDLDVAHAVACLANYVKIVRTVELADARDALQSLEEGLTHLTVQNAEAEHLRITRAFVEASLENRLRTAERRLVNLEALLRQIAASHRELVDGWSKGESEGKDLLRRLRDETRQIEALTRAFDSPITGAGQ